MVHSAKSRKTDMSVQWKYKNKMSHLKRAWNSMSDTNVIIFVSCAYGLVYSIDSTFMDKPLSQLFSGAIDGIIYTIGTSIVTSFLNEDFHPLLPIAMGLSMGRHIVRLF